MSKANEVPISSHISSHKILQAKESYKFYRTIINLRIISYNCQSLNAKLDIVSTLLNAINIPSVRKLGPLYGRSSGGLAILWKKNSNLK